MFRANVCVARTAGWGSLLLLPLGCMLTIAPAATALAQEQEADGTGDVEEVVVTGSRRVTSRVVTDMAVPVDSIGVAALANQSHNSIKDMIKSEVPSFNSVPAPTGGTPSFTTPPNLRGMSPDHLLVLVNGKRWHRAGDIPTLGALVQGSQGSDITGIPAIALKRLEVLRDGAAAQYGSDAIAGVFNFILNDEAEGGFLEGKFGQFTEGDGQSYMIAGTYGVPLANDSGFIRASAEFSENDPTSRGEVTLAQRQMVEAGVPGALGQRASTGNPRVRHNIKTFLNGAVDIGSDSELYGWAYYHERSSMTILAERIPWSKAGVFTTGNILGDGVQYRLVGDLTPDDDEQCPGTIAGGDLVPASVDGADDQALLQTLLTMPNCFTWTERFPAGFAARFLGEMSDSAGTLGFRGETEGEWLYDFSFGLGQSLFDFSQYNVPSPSFGSDNVTTDFDNMGGREQHERIVNIDFSKGFEVGFASPLNIATGFQWLEETFVVTLGDQLGWDFGPLADQGFAGGTDVYFGYSPKSVGEWSRTSRGLYVDLEADVTERLLLNVAGRYESYSDIGDDETIYKVAARFKVTDSLALRAAVSTGYHVPTPAQQNFTYASTERDSAGELVEVGIITPKSSVAQDFGAVAPVPESSDNYSLGLTFQRDKLSVALDYFEIEMDDRITLSASQEINDEQRQRLIEEGITGADFFTSIQFFTNDFSTKTTGFDLTASMPLEIGSATTDLNFNINKTKTRVTQFSDLTSASRVVALETALPEYRSTLTATHEQDRFRIQGRVAYWDSSTEVLFGNVPLDTGNAVLVDLEAGYYLTDALTLIIGAENILDEYPINHYNEPVPNQRGIQYPSATPYGYNGAYWYGKVQYRF